MEETKMPLAVIFTLLFLVSTSSALDLHTLRLSPLPSASPITPESETDSGSDPFSLPLHHVDSLLPSNQTPSQLFQLRLQRDALRLASLASLQSNRSGRAAGFSSSIISGLSLGSGEYFTRVGVGSPPKYLYLVLDTGSDIIWLQCSPCKRCYSQSDPIFNPAKSSSFASLPCSSPLCRRLDSPGCNSKSRSCLYQVSYGDGSFTVGDFSTDTLTFRKSRIPKVALGCGHDNQGLFVGAAGLLGLGRGKLSFPIQTGPRFSSKFSYCLVDRSSSSGSKSSPSSLMFGDASVSKTAKFTPIIPNPKLDTFYYIELLSISVGGTRVPGITASLFKLDPNSGNGGVIIDSGTSVTRLTRAAYASLRDAFRAGVRSLKTAAEFSLFDTCFDLSRKTEVKVPTVVLHFRGADVSLPATNYLIPVDSSGTFCFAFAGTTGGLSIIGISSSKGFGWFMTSRVNGSGLRHVAALSFLVDAFFTVYVLAAVQCVDLGKHESLFP